MDADGEKMDMTANVSFCSNKSYRLARVGVSAMGFGMCLHKLRNSHFLNIIGTLEHVLMQGLGNDLLSYESHWNVSLYQGLIFVLGEFPNLRVYENHWNILWKGLEFT